MTTQQAIQDAMATLPPPTPDDPSSPELMPSNDRPRSRPGGIGSWSTLTDCLSEPNSPEFRRLVIGLDETHHPKVRALAKWTERWIKAAATNERTPTRWFAFCGQPGTGKSHALRAAYEFLRAHGTDLWPKWHKTPPRARFATWSRVSALGPGSWSDFEDEIHASRFVFIDDLGSEIDRFKSGEPAERLRTVMDMCATKWVLLSSNLTRETFGRVFDPRVQSRLERAAVLDMAGVADYRPRLRE